MYARTPTIKFPSARVLLWFPRARPQCTNSRLPLVSVGFPPKKRERRINRNGQPYVAGVPFWSWVKAKTQEQLRVSRSNPIRNTQAASLGALTRASGDLRNTWALAARWDALCFVSSGWELPLNLRIGYPLPSNLEAGLGFPWTSETQCFSWFVHPPQGS